MKIALCLMAAGRAKRFGGCKQLATLDGQTILAYQLTRFEQLIEQAKQQNITLVPYLVLGQYQAQIQAELANLNTVFRVLINPSWQQGLGTSIGYACQQILPNQQPDGVAIFLLDQVAIDVKEYLQLLLKFKQQPKQIIHAVYQQQAGVPAIFSKPYYQELTQLHGEKGAKALFQQANCQTLPMESAAIDIDTKTDLMEFSKSLNKEASNA